MNQCYDFARSNEHTGQTLPQLSQDRDLRSARMRSLPLKLRPKGCPETTVRNNPFTLSNIPEERRSHLHRGWSPKSPKAKDYGPWMFLVLVICPFSAGLWLPSCRKALQKINYYFRSAACDFSYPFGMTQHLKKNALDPRHELERFVRNIKSRGPRSSGTLRRNDWYIATDVSG